jgi:hypothetical protein
MITNGLAIWDEDVYKLDPIFLLAVLYADQGKVGVIREDPPTPSTTAPPRQATPLTTCITKLVVSLLIFPPQTENAVIFAILFGWWARHLLGVSRNWRHQEAVGILLIDIQSSEWTPVRADNKVASIWQFANSTVTRSSPSKMWAHSKHLELFFISKLSETKHEMLLILRQSG